MRPSGNARIAWESAWTTRVVSFPGRRTKSTKRAYEDSGSRQALLRRSDLADGSERWRTPRHEVGSSFGTPTIATMRGRAQLITNGGARIRGYDPLTGRELWSLAARTRNVTPTPVVAHDLIQSKLCP